MLMNHKNFYFTQIPDKTNDVIFLKISKKVQKPCFGAIFDHFWSFLPDGDFSQKNLALSHAIIYGPPTPR